MNQQKQQQLQLQQQIMLQQQQQPLSKRRNNNTSTTSNKNKNIINNRKRSHSSSSTSSSGSPSTNLFSTASSSDSGSSSMTSIKSSNNNNTNSKKKKITASNGKNSSDSSSAESGNTTPPDIPPSSSVSLTSSNNIPQRLTAQRSVPAFLNKLYNMVEDLSTNDLVRWSKDGTSFIVEKHEEFAKTVLPRFYKHNTFASFVRQLNMYDFHKVPHLQQGVLIAESEHEIWEFSNPHFQRGRPDLLVLVTRKRNRDRDAVDNENVSLQSLVQDLAVIKKYQSTIGTDLRSLHHDNEILWQETLSSREKYQRHQEAIEKILQFLTAIFANDHLAISMNNADSLPKGLIEEAVSLAGMSNKMDDAVVNNIKATSSSSANALPTSSANALPTSSLTNILSSVLKLYSANPSSQQPTEIPPSKLIHRKSYKNDRNESIASSTDSLQYPQSPKNMNLDEDIESPSTLIDFSKTLNTATRSAQNITQDIDMLQMNIESLANNLGIDPGQFDDDLETDRCFQDNYSNMMNSTNTADRAKLYAIADSNADLDKKNFTSVYDNKKQDEQMANLMNNQNQFNFNLSATTPTSRQFQPRQTSRKHYTNNSNSNSMQGYNNNSNTNTNNNNSNDNNSNNNNLPQPPKPHPIQPPQRQQQQRQSQSDNSSNSTYSQLLSSMNYSDSFGPNYPSSGNETPIVTANNNNNSGSSSSDYYRSYDNSSASNTNSNQPTLSTTPRNMNNSYYNNGNNNNQSTNDTILSPGTSDYNAMVNDYADMMNPQYFNTNNGNDNYNDT